MKVRDRLKMLILLAAGVIIASGASLAQPASAYASDAVDFSHEKCRANDPSRVANWVGHYSLAILGVNGGGDWEKNTCLKSELKHVDKYMLYSNTNYPSDGCHEAPSRKAAYHCGYNAGIWDLHYASSQGAHSSVWFIDVEEGPGIPWSSSRSLNSVFLYGMARAFENNGITVGWYAPLSHWDDITGGWHPGGIDWYPTGHTGGVPSHQAIKDACHTNFTKGPGVALYQYIDQGLDHDNAC